MRAERTARGCRARTALAGMDARARARPEAALRAALALGVAVVSHAAAPAGASTPVAAWGSEERLTMTTTDSETGLNHTALAVDGAGTIHLVWAEQNGVRGNYQIYARRHAGGAWQPAALVVPFRPEGAGNLLGAKYPSLVCDGNDTLHLAWHDYRVAGINNAEIYYKNCAAGAAWDTSAATEIRLTTSLHPESGGDNGYVPTLAVGRFGDLDAAWYDFRYDGTAGEILTKGRRNDAWDLPPGDAADRNASETAGDSQFPAAVVDDRGHLHLAWQDDTAGNLRILYRRRDAATGLFDPAVELTTVATATAPTLAVDGPGRVFVAWVDTRDGARRIYARRREPDGGWTPAEPATPPGLNADEPALAVDGFGQPHLAWNDTRIAATNREIFLQSTTPGGGWDSTGNSDVRISNGAGNSTRPSLAADATGRLVVAWRDRRDGNHEIYARIGQVEPPVSAVGTAPPPGDGYGTLRAWPNPSRGVVTLAWTRAAGPAVPGGGSAPGAPPVRWEIFDARGRLVRAADAPAAAPYLWDGRGADGAPLPAGRYWARARSGGAEARAQLVRLP